MIAPAWLLFLLGLLGATDIWLFHTRAHHLHDHAPARAELVTHFLRGPTYCALFLMVPKLVRGVRGLHAQRMHETMWP